MKLLEDEIQTVTETERTESRRMGKLELEKTEAPIEKTGVQVNELTPAANVAGGPAFFYDKTKSLSLSRQNDTAYRLTKRCFDFLSSLIVSLVMLIPTVFLMLCVAIKDPGNPLYFQKRAGKGGGAIHVAKIRTMKKHSDHLEEMLTSQQLEEYRREYKLLDDPRLIGWKKTGDGQKCFGAILRKLSLDELPQIFYNICLKGNMSVVGPRPILQEELEQYYTPEEQREILSVKPGLTGYWQAYARNNARYEDGKRQAMELYYVQNRSLQLDIKILFATVKTVLKKSGV